MEPNMIIKCNGINSFKVVFLTLHLEVTSRGTGKIFGQHMLC